jgi:drug/metabolite transporter (DMT)-like permease
VRSRWGDAALLGAAFFYGTTFVVVQDAVDEVAPSAFLAARFAVATAALAPFALIRARKTVTPGLWRDGALAAATMAVGYALQTVGLQYTTSSRSAFITYLLVVMVPVMAAVALRRVPTHRVMVAVGVAAAGLFLLTDVSGGGFGRGELFTLGCAVGFAANVVVIAAVIERHDALMLTFVQLAMLALVFAVPGQIQGGYGFDSSTWLAVAFTGVFASAVAFSFQNWGQRTVGPSRAAILLVMEPVFAAVIARIDGERLGGAALVGAVLIVAAVLISELSPADADADQRGSKARLRRRVIDST